MGSQASFSTGWMQLFQVVFAPIACEPPYWKRADVYGAGSTEQWFAATS
jgi:hypothetical protein